MSYPLVALQRPISWYFLLAKRSNILFAKCSQLLILMLFLLFTSFFSKRNCIKSFMDPHPKSELARHNGLILGFPWTESRTLYFMAPLFSSWLKFLLL